MTSRNTRALGTRAAVVKNALFVSVAIPRFITCAQTRRGWFGLGLSRSASMLPPRFAQHRDGRHRELQFNCNSSSVFWSPGILTPNGFL
jgi:hypothetical protein